MKGAAREVGIETGRRRWACRGVVLFVILAVPVWWFFHGKGGPHPVDPGLAGPGPTGGSPAGDPPWRPPGYDFSILYTILYDARHGPPPSPDPYQRRLALLRKILERESFGRIRVRPILDLFDATSLGDDRLAYETRTIQGWIDALETHYRKVGIDYDILIFYPASEAYAPWCTDGPSMGFHHHGKGYLCLETFLDPGKKEQDRPAAALMVHKIFHTFGYNHISQENRPMNLLRWNIGLPKTRVLPLANVGERPRIIFDRHIMKVLGFLPRNVFEEGCPDAGGLVCRENDRYSCENSYDLRCLDSDGDRVPDGEDDYLLTPHGRGGEPDGDGDGIPDALDLCPGNGILFRGNIRLEKERGIVEGQEKVEIEMKAASTIRGINLYGAQNIRGFIRFRVRPMLRVAGNRLSLEARVLSPIARLKVFYDSPEGSFYRPFYLYRAPQRIEYVNEKEWFYFSRFGCDVPLTVDFSDPATYDRDLDGLPDPELFGFAKALAAGYDWDSDGIPDVEDSLPTVHGTCSDELVRGVPDSDGDGWCDPAAFTFSDDSGMMGGDLVISYRNDPEADACPYVAGSSKGGCPTLRGP